jgi:excisionase family DNA binding protein
MLEERLKPEDKPAPVSPKMFYTRKEFCDHFNIHISTLNRMINDSRIKSVKVGKRVCINNKEIQRIEGGGVDFL